MQGCHGMTLQRCRCCARPQNLSSVGRKGRAGGSVGHCEGIRNSKIVRNPWTLQILFLPPPFAEQQDSVLALSFSKCSYNTNFYSV